MSQSPVEQIVSFRLTPLTASIAAVLYPMQNAIAQVDEDDPLLEEVIVTATLRQADLQSIPQSITALTTEDIRRNNLQNLSDIVNVLPSLTLSSTQPGRRDLVYRGVASDTEQFYTESSVAVYLDESPITLISQQPFPRMVDIERIESLPGPQATLFGSASQTGTFRIITNKPNTDGVSGEVFAEIGTTKGGDPSYELNAWVNVPFSEDFAMRFVAYSVNEGGYIDNVYHETYRGQGPNGPPVRTDNSQNVKEDQNEWKLNGGRISALWNISDNWYTTLTVVHEDSEEKGIWESDPSLGDFKIARFHDEFRTDKWTQYGLTIKGDLGFAEFTSNTAYFDRNVKYEWDNMAYEQYKDSYWGYYLGYAGYNTAYTYGVTFNDQNQDRFSQEFRLASQTDSAFQWMLGLYYEDLHDDWYYGADNPDLMQTPSWAYAQYAAYYNYYLGYPTAYPLPATDISYLDLLDRDTKQWSVFGELSYDFNDQWRAVFGARWFKYDRYWSTQIFYPADKVPPFGSADTNGLYISESKPSDTLFKGSIQYQINDTKMIYALYSQGFRLGGLNSQRAAATGLVPLEYDPDTLDNYEIGLKSKWWDQRLLLNATFFNMEWNEFQQGGSSFGGPWWLRGTFNASDARSRGVEVNGTILFTDRFTVDYSALWADAEFTEDFVFPGGGTVITKGDPMVNAPKFKGWLAFDYIWPGFFDSEMWVRWDTSYTKGVYTSLSNATTRDPSGKTDSYSLSNLTIGAAWNNGWTVSFYIRNVFDEKAELWRDNSQAYIADWFGGDWNRITVNYARPRTMGFQFIKRWN